MLDYIKCPECGNHIGLIYMVVNIVKTFMYKKDLQKKHKNIDVQNTALIDQIEINLNDIFKQLNVPNYCCRQHLITSLDYDKAQYCI